MNAQLATLAFYAKHQGWQSFDAGHRATLNAIRRLEARGFLLVSWPTHQAQHTGKVFAR